MRSLVSICGLLFALVAPDASAAATTSALTYVIDTSRGSRELVRAEGVVVGHEIFNVDFVQGRCTDLYDGCDAGTDFDFRTFADAFDAAVALETQVFVDGLLGNFNSNPDLTRGCSPVSLSCLVTIPFALRTPDFLGNDRVGVSVFFGGILTPASVNAVGQTDFTSTFDYTNPPIPGSGVPEFQVVFAQFTPVPIPLPTSAWLLLSGAGLLLVTRRIRLS